MLTNEQDVVKAKESIALLKEKYSNSLVTYLNAVKNSAINNDELLKNLLELQTNANTYFNYYEEFVGNSSLLGAHDNPYWAQGFAEDCFSVLKIMPQHYELLKNGFEKFGGNIDICPISTAFANMERISKKYLKRTEVTKLEKEFSNAKLPVYGFKNEENNFMSRKLQIILSFIFGIIFVLLLMGTAYLTPNPSNYQYMVFRVVLALAGGGVVAVFPGFIEVNFGNWLRAGGALAVFVVIYFISPAVLPS